MQPLPHRYLASASATSAGDIALGSPGLATITSSSPPQFGGPDGYWSPETLLVGAVAACYVLTFRALAAASSLDWLSLDCSVTGSLTRVDRALEFTEFVVHARLALPHSGDEVRANRLLEKAETQCLISNSLKAPARLDVELVVAAAA